MGPPSSFFLAVVAIIILSFAILGFISAVNYKNLSNNPVEAETISKDSANTLSTTMIIFGLVMVVIFIWLAYVIFNYDNGKKVGIDPRDASLLVKAKESINKLASVKDSYNKLKDNYDKFKDKKAEEFKKYSDWNYCPSPRIKLKIKEGTGKVIEPVYGKNGIEALIIKPEKKDPNDKSDPIDCNGYKKLDFEVETQKCYEFRENNPLLNQIPGLLLGQNLGPLSQSMLIPGMMNQRNLFAPQVNTNLNPKECGAGSLKKKTVEIPGISFSSSCNNDANKKLNDAYPNTFQNSISRPAPLSLGNVDVTKMLNVNI
jgi:hypothetical protein